MRVATLTMSLRAQNTVLNLQNQFSRAQEQVSTGKISQSYSGLSGDDARVRIQLREGNQNKESYVHTIVQVRPRTNHMGAAPSGSTDCAAQMRM